MLKDIFHTCTLGLFEADEPTRYRPSNNSRNHAIVSAALDELNARVQAAIKERDDKIEESDREISKFSRVAAAVHGFLEYGSGVCLDGLLEEMQRAGYNLDEYATVVAALRGSQSITDRARAVVASWEQWQAASEADKPMVWRYVEGWMERLREAVDEQDEA